MRKTRLILQVLIGAAFVSCLAMAGPKNTPTPSGSPMKPTPTYDPYGLQPEYKIFVEQDRVEGTKKEVAPLGAISSCDKPENVTLIGLAIVKMTNSDGSAEYSLEANYDSDDGIFIEHGESLLLKVDGKKMIFSGPGSLKHREVYESQISESAYYPATKAQLRHIAKAKEIVVKLVGMSSYAQGCFGDTNWDYLKRAIADLVDKPASKKEK